MKVRGSDDRHKIVITLAAGKPIVLDRVCIVRVVTIFRDERFEGVF